MRLHTQTLARRFGHTFSRSQSSVLAETITEVHDDLVKTSDFDELKSIVRDLAIAQQRTETKVEELAVAQRRTETRVEELAVNMSKMTQSMSEMKHDMNKSSKATKQAISEMRHDIRESSKATEQAINQSSKATKQAISGMRNEIGGLSRTMSYALENEAYRVLPAYLKKHFDITVHSRFVRTVVENEELDFYAHGEQNGRPVCIIGESKLKIDEQRHKGKELGRIMSQLDRKATVVQQNKPDCGIVRMLVTHYVRPSARQLLEDEGVLIVQSFDWG